MSLAAYFPNTHFVFIDANPVSISILKARAGEAGLKNISAFEFRFEFNKIHEAVAFIAKQYPDFDLGIALHSCGEFTDMVLEICYELKVS